MDELREVVMMVANLLSGGLGYGVMQFLKWALGEYGIVLEGKLAVNVTLIVSAVLAVVSTVVGFATFHVALPTDAMGWLTLVVQGAMSVMGAATIIYKNIRSKKEG